MRKYWVLKCHVYFYIRKKSTTPSPAAILGSLPAVTQQVEKIGVWPLAGHMCFIVVACCLLSYFAWKEMIGVFCSLLECRMSVSGCIEYSESYGGIWEEESILVGKDCVCGIRIGLVSHKKLFCEICVMSLSWQLCKRD